jgi:hypothetical protein
MPARPANVAYVFTHNGQSNFAVWLYCAGGNDLVANEIGPVTGETVVELERGPCVWSVTADGEWAVRRK